MSRADRPIGVFDSGIGGLTVIHALRQMLPQEELIYLGDTARLPYGSKSHHTIERYTLQMGELLQRHDPKLIVIACNTASAHGLPALQAVSPCPVIGVIEPGAEAAAAVPGPVGVIGTLATVGSGAYEAAILRRDPAKVIYSTACPLLVPLAEEGWFDDPVTDTICRRYLDLLPAEVRTVVLGCTHYPTLMPSLERCRPGTHWIDSGRVTAKAVDRLLQGTLGYRTASARGELRVQLTDASTRLKEVGSRFLEEVLGDVEVVEI
ncbi:glutamate racemase [Geothrix fuzhouensis]|uniref:glutamate racemase n=1 Tax=Geothrix fuzhouensis TaxID=2966451 RepID=UPI002147E3E0|nr:glutamate racemase [Geothrix fuzhouensis]